MIFEVILSVILAILVLDFLHKKSQNEKVGSLRGPTAWPLLGNILLVINRTPEDTLNFMGDLFNEYGSNYYFWIFNQFNMITADPKDLEVILSSPRFMQKGYIYDVLKSWLGTGLLLSTGQKWHSRRKALTPAFHFKILEQFVDVFDQQSSVFVEQLEPHADGVTDINIHPFICLASLDIVAETAMGTKINAQVDRQSQYARAVNEITNLMADRFITGWQKDDWVFALLHPMRYLRQRQLLKILHDITENIIVERRESLQKAVADESSGKNRKAFLDLLLQTSINGQPFSNDDIREEVNTFMFEGHDTTTSAVSFALHFLSRNPEVQRRVFQETQEVFGSDKSAPVTYRTLQDLKYTECVIKEALRIYPSVPVISRQVTEDVTINNKNLPAGSSLVVSIYHSHRNPKYFPDPEKFIPERHLADNNTDSFVNTPFSAGPRNCIGQKFAMLTMKSIISKVVRFYEILPVGEELKTVITVVLRPKNGVHIALKKRT